MFTIRKTCLIIAVICLILSVTALICNLITLSAINSVKVGTFTECEHIGNTVIYTTSNGNEAKITFGKSAVKIEKSYRFAKKERTEILCFIRRRLSMQKIKISLSDMSGEWAAHNVAYAFGVERERTADADLDYFKDKRFYVAAVTVAFGFMGF